MLGRALIIGSSSMVLLCAVLQRILLFILGDAIKTFFKSLRASKIALFVFNWLHLNCSYFLIVHYAL